MSVPSPDPGMAVKMAPPGIANLDAALSGRPIDEDAVRGLIDFVHAPRLLGLPDGHPAHPLVAHLALSAGLRERVKDAILGFPYWMDEPGTDAMCIWSENHQVMLLGRRVHRRAELPGRAVRRFRVSPDATAERRQTVWTAGPGRPLPLRVHRVGVHHLLRGGRRRARS